MDSDPKAAPLPPEKHSGAFWPQSRRRPFLLLCLLVGLAVFLIWLPGDTRTALWTALRAQRTLVTMLFLFVLLALSLVWSVGQRFDSRVFLLFNLRGYHSTWLDGLMWLATQLGSML